MLGKSKDRIGPSKKACQGSKEFYQVAEWHQRYKSEDLTPS